MWQEATTFVLSVYNSAAIPLRVAYGFWVGFFFLYWYASLHDKYSNMQKERELKEKNFPKVLFFFGLLSVLLHHGGIWWQWPTLIVMTQNFQSTFFILGFLFMAIGLFTVSWARAVLDGYWGPNIYKYKHEKDNILICNGVYRHIRHPVYFGQILMTLGTWLLSNSWFFCIFPISIIIINIFRFKKEEHDLQERFSEKFQEYKKQTDAMVPWVV